MKFCEMLTPIEPKQNPFVIAHESSNESMPPVSAPADSVKDIINKCRAARHNDMRAEKAYKVDKSEMNKSTKKIAERLGMELYVNKLRQEKTIETANKISEFSDNLPIILKTIFEEDKNRMKDQSEDEVKVLNQYDTRKLNNQYNLILKSAEKKVLNISKKCFFG